MYQANARHTGQTPIQVGFQTVSARWSVSHGTYQNSAVTTGSGKVFFARSDKRLVALDSATGALAWQVPFTTAAYVNPPSYANGRVYIQTVNHSSDTYLRCYDANTGQLVFQSAHSAQWEQYLAPTLYDGKVYVNGGTYGGMYAFDATTGAQLWFNGTLAQYDEWTPAVDGDTAYAYVGGTLSAINRLTGAVRYTIQDPAFSWAGWSMNLAPVLGGMNDVLIVHGGRLVRFDLLNRQIAYNLTGNFSGQPAVSNSVVYVISSGTLQARSQSNGALLWSFGLPSETLRDEVALTINHAFVRTSTGIHAVDLNTRQAVWSRTGAGTVAITPGAIYVSGTDGTISSMGFAPQPTPISMTPSYQSYLLPPGTVTVHGSAFQVDPGSLTVSVGGTPATNVVVIDDQTLQCVVPIGTPGVYDVRVQNQYGSGTLARGFAVTPAVDVVTAPFPGTALAIDYYQSPRHQTLALLAFDVPRALTLPPFHGDLCVNPSTAFTLFYVPGWVNPLFPLSLPIPSNPGLSGVNVTLQSLSGTSLWTLQGAFSNCETLQIR